MTVARAELWKLGQLRPGDRIRFVAMSFEQALMAEQAWEQALQALTAPVLVITSYSIHYTKLYDVGQASRPARGR